MPSDYPPIPHPQNCQCQQCRAMWAAVLAQTPEAVTEPAKEDKPDVA